MNELAECEKLVACQYCNAPKGVSCNAMYKGRQGEKNRPHLRRRLDAESVKELEAAANTEEGGGDG